MTVHQLYTNTFYTFNLIRITYGLIILNDFPSRKVRRNKGLLIFRFTMSGVEEVRDQVEEVKDLVEEEKPPDTLETENNTMASSWTLLEKEEPDLQNASSSSEGGTAAADSEKKENEGKTRYNEILRL